MRLISIRQVHVLSWQRLLARQAHVLSWQGLLAQSVEHKSNKLAVISSILIGTTHSFAHGASSHTFCPRRCLVGQPISACHDSPAAAALTVSW